jgi:hypothetical protein
VLQVEHPVTHTTGNSTPPQSGPTASNLPAGTYIVTITDNNGCTATAQATVNNQGAPTVTVTGTDAHCGNSDGGATQPQLQAEQLPIHIHGTQILFRQDGFNQCLPEEPTM